MVPPRLCYIGLQLLTLTYTAQSLVMLTANSEDVKKLARKFVSQSLADKIAEFLSITPIKVDKATSIENNLNNIESNSDAMDMNEELELRNNDVHERNAPFRTTKDLNTPAVRDLELDVTPRIEPKYRQEESSEMSPKKKIKRHHRKLIKKHHVQNNRNTDHPGDTEHLDRGFRNIDRHVHFKNVNKPQFPAQNVKLDRYEDKVNKHNRSLHHPHITNLKSIEEETENIEDQSTDRKKVKKILRKPSQPNRDLLRLVNQFPKYKQLSPNPDEDSKPDHNDNFEQNPVDNFKKTDTDHLNQDPSDNLKQDDIDNNEQSSISNFDNDHVREPQHEPNHNLEHDSIDNVKKDHVSNLKHDRISKFKPDRAGFEDDEIDVLKKATVGDSNQDPINATEFEPIQTDKLKQQSTIEPLRIRKVLLKRKKIHDPQSEQDKEPHADNKQLHNSGKNKQKKYKRKGHRYSKHKFTNQKYFPNKAKKAKEAEKQKYENKDAESQELPKKIQHSQSDSRPTDDPHPGKDVLRIVDKYPIHKKTDHLEPKPEPEDKMETKAETEQTENNDSQSSVIAEFLTSKMPKTESIDENTSHPKHTDTSENFKFNDSPESDDTIIAQTKEVFSTDTTPTVYHGEQVTDEKVTRKDTEVLATSGNMKLSIPRNNNEKDKVWDKIEKAIHERSTSKKIRVF